MIAKSPVQVLTKLLKFGIGRQGITERSLWAFLTGFVTTSPTGQIVSKQGQDDGVCGNDEINGAVLFS